MSTTSEKQSFTTEWLHQNHEIYTAATNHTFIASIRDGSVDVVNFKHWMEQDYHFVREFVRFVASVLLKVPRDAAEQDADVILGGLQLWKARFLGFGRRRTSGKCFWKESLHLNQTRTTAREIHCSLQPLVPAPSCISVPHTTQFAELRVLSRDGEPGVSSICTKLETTG